MCWGHGAMLYPSGEGASAPPSSWSVVSPSPVDHGQPQVEGPKGFPTVTFKSLSILSIVSLYFSVNYKLALAKGICHLPLQRLNPVLLQLLNFDTP